MSERFNFYDVYGYLIPGFVLLGLLWLPVGIASGGAPNLGFADALGGLFAAYILGHVLSGVTLLAFPSGRRVSRTAFRYPSDDMLDESFDPDRAPALRKKIKEEFAVDLSRALPDLQLRKVRQHAFLLCRDRLVLQDKAAYAEQFEGMYSMMRGISGASIIAAYYLLGWLLSSAGLELQQAQVPAGELPMTVAFFGVAVAGLDFWLTRKGAMAVPQGEPAAVVQPAESGPITPVQQPGKGARLVKWAQSYWPETLFWLLVGGATYAGRLVGLNNPSLAGQPSSLVALAAGAIFLAGRCYNSFQYFARTFADTVYRNVLALPKSTASQKVPAEPA